MAPETPGAPTTEPAAATEPAAPTRPAPSASSPARPSAPRERRPKPPRAAAPHEPRAGQAPRPSSERHSRPPARPSGSPHAKTGGGHGFGAGRKTAGDWASYRLDLEYDGTRYSGWQEQQNARTVAGELRQALVTTLGASAVVELGGAGRTDAGVHALGQIAHLRLREKADPLTLQHALNDLLPSDINIVRLAVAANRFHARHDADMRSYVYQISSRRTAFAKRFVWWLRDELDPAAMRAVWSTFAGRHDFAAFTEQPEGQESTVVVVNGVELVTHGDMVLLRIAASHFLWKMVRRLVGTVVRVGTGEITADDVASLLAGSALPRDRKGQPRTPAAWTAPPSGLFLERVVYRGEPGLGQLRPVFDLR